MLNTEKTAKLSAKVETVTMKQEKTDEKKELLGIVMPRFVTTLGKAPQIPLTTILTQGTRILNAVKTVHSRGYVHLDIKPDNIFIDQKGNWFLGDFGSCKPAGAIISSSTPMYYPLKLRGLSADKSYDMFMLGFSFLIAYDKENFQDMFADLHVPSVEEVKKKFYF